MFKKFFLSAAVVALIFMGCDSDSSTAPSSTAPSSTTKDSGAVKGALDRHEYSEKTDDGNCVVTKLSANSFSITYNQEGAATKIVSTIDGSTIEIEYQSTYGKSVPESYVESLCETNKQEAMSKNATVSCDGRTILVRETDVTYLTFDEALNSAKETCNLMNGSTEQLNEFTADTLETWPTETEDSVTCSSRKTENSFVLTARVPDSLSMQLTAEYYGESYAMVMVLEFMPNVPQSEIDDSCQELEGLYSDSYDGESMPVEVVCSGRQISVVTSGESDENPISEIAAEMSDFCNEIKMTGKFPD